MISSQIQETSVHRKVGYKPIVLVAFILILDQAIKFFVYQYITPIDHAHYLYPYGGIGIFKNFAGIEFSINHMTNKGAAWGFLGNYQISLIIVRICLIIGSILYVFFFNRQSSWQIPILLIIAGAVGNVADFFVYGHVIDMFHFVLWGYDFPIFNLADSAICMGIASLFFLSWFEP